MNRFNTLYFFTWSVLAVNEGGGEEPSVAVSRVLGGHHRRQVVQNVELALGLFIVVSGDQEVHIEGSLKYNKKSFCLTIALLVIFIMPYTDLVNA